MEFIICSDNHGDQNILLKILKDHPNAVSYIHCGDSECSNDFMKPFVAVTGNTDYFYKFPEMLITQIGELRILVLHGHTMPFGSRVEAMVDLAKSKNCTVICTGHTHIPMDKTVRGVRVINPGSLFYNRDGSGASYCVATTDGITIQSLTKVQI